jgi:hypothetical protein
MIIILEVVVIILVLLWLCQLKQALCAKRLHPTTTSINNVLNKVMCKVIVLQFSKATRQKTFLNLESFFSFENLIKIYKFWVFVTNQSIPLHSICPSLCLLNNVSFKLLIIYQHVIHFSSF